MATRRTYPRWGLWLDILASTLALALILYATVVALRRPEFGMAWDAGSRVTALMPSGPAEYVGIRVGDRLVEIDGQPMASPGLSILRWRPHDTVDVVIERDGRRLVRSLTLLPLSGAERWGALGVLIVALGFWIAGSMLLRSGTKGFEVRLYRLIGQVGSATLAAGSLSSIGLVWAGHLFGILGGALVPLILHFHLRLPGASAARWQRPVLAATYALGIAVSLSFTIPVSGELRRYAALGSAALRLALVGVLLGSLLWLVVRYARAQTLDVRRKLRLVILGASWAILPLVLLSLLPDITGASFVPYQFTFPFLVLVPFTYSYAIGQLDLMRFDRILNQSLVYLFLIFVLVGAYFASLSLIAHLLPSRAYQEELVGAVLLAIVPMLIIPFHGAVQRTIDRLFYGSWHDYRSVVSDVSRTLSGTLDRHSLEQLLLERASRTLRARGSALLLPTRPPSTRLVGRQLGDLVLDPADLSLEVDGCLARQLRALHRPVETTDLRREIDAVALAPAERRLLEADMIRWWVPAVSDGILNGLLILGARVGNERFDAEDLQILSTLGNAAALAIKNVLLVEELRLRLTEIDNSHRTLERMHRQVLSVREAEQKRLARELHDGPVQQLIALRYRLHECEAGSETEDLRRALRQLRDEAGVLLNDLRAVCSELRPPLLDAFGLASAIQAHAEEAAERYALRVSAVVDSEKEGQIPEEVAVALFRVYQEAFANIVKHANAGQVTIRLSVQAPLIRLEMEDDGLGFAVPEPMDRLVSSAHFGLLGIRERIELLGGTFELASSPGAGTRLAVQVDLDQVLPAWSG